MNKRLIAVLMMIFMAAWIFPEAVYAASRPELPKLTDPAVYHTPADDYIGGDCVLTSCKMMLRRYAISKGSYKWSSITNADLRPHAAPYGGMKYEFDYTNDGLKYHVMHGYFSGSTLKSKTKELRKLLKKHPEGVIVWGGSATKSGGPHAVLAVRVDSDDVIYAGEPAYNVGSWNKGIQKWTDTTMASFVKCTKYWFIERVSGSPTSAGKANIASTLSISSVRYPETLDEGEAFTIRGTVESNYRITRVVVSVVNADAKTVISKYDEPDSWMYDVHDLDSVVKFGTLEPGTYTYKIRAKDEKTAAYKVLHKNKFTVKAVKKESSEDTEGSKNTKAQRAESTAKTKASALAASGIVLPGTLMQGDSFALKGRISSNYKLKSVTVSVINSKGKAIMKKTVSPGKKKYNLSLLAKKFKFKTLKPGTYTFRIKAADTKQTLRLINKKFTVREKSTLKVERASKPDRIEEGSGFTVKGLVSSKYRIKTVTVSVVSSKGKTKLSKTAKPGAKTFRLSRLDSKVKFGSLSKGSYTYYVKAVDERTSKTLVKKKFTVY